MGDDAIGQMYYVIDSIELPRKIKTQKSNEITPLKRSHE